MFESSGSRLVSFPERVRPAQPAREARFPESVGDPGAGVAKMIPAFIMQRHYHCLGKGSGEHHTLRRGHGQGIGSDFRHPSGP